MSVRNYNIGGMPTIANTDADAAPVEQILEALRIRPQIRLAILFGSLAEGRAHAVSDLDLALDLGREMDAEDKIALVSELAQRTGRPVDLVDLRRVGEPLLGQILKYGKRILGSDTAYAQLITRHVFDQADFVPYRDRILAERRKAWIGQ